MWLWASYFGTLFPCLYNGHVEFSWAIVRQLFSDAPHKAGVKYVNLHSPLATVSLKTPTPNGFVLSLALSPPKVLPPGQTPGTGHITCHAAAETAWLPYPDAYKWLLHTQCRSGSPLATGPLGRGLTVLTASLNPTLWFPLHARCQELEANA